MQSDFDKDLQSYFTDMEYLRDMFKDFVSAEKLPKRLIVFHGVGGVGKSSLLRMFRLHCKSEKIPVALASGDDAKSVLDVVTRWAEDLKEDGVKLPSLGKTLETYRAIQAKVDTEAKKTGDQLGNLAGKGVATIGSVLGSMLPGIGPIAGPVIGMGAEALTDWLRGFLKKPEIDLLLDPAKKLTSDFLEDLAKTAEKKRMVLLLDTYEQMSALEDWVGETAQKIHPNVLMVIAGRKLPDWQRVWSGWMMNAQVEELKPMTEEVMRDLIHRYYATMRGGEPDPAQVDAIIKFARGLPMVITSAVQLWVKYGVEDFQSVKAEIVANLVDRLMEGVPSNLIPALEAAAVVRWFDQPILRAVLNKEDVRDVYNELRRFPFVRSRSEGLALHDSVREMMEENLRVQDSERHVELHERAAVYFEKRLEKVTGEEAERLGLERLYHRVRADEETGIKLFQEMAEELTRYRLVNRLRALLNDTNTYLLERENSKLWRMYYGARLIHLEENWSDAEKTYRSIIHNPNAELKLHAYTLCDYGDALQRAGSDEKAVETFEQIPLLGIQLDSKLIFYLVELSGVYRKLGRWNDSIIAMEKAEALFRQTGNLYGQVWTIYRRKFHFWDWGLWKQGLQMHREGIEILSQLSETSSLKVSLLSGLAIAWSWIGQYAEGEHNLREAIGIAEKMGLSESLMLYHFRDLALLLALQGKTEEAQRLVSESVKLAKKLGNAMPLAFGQAFQALVAMRMGEFAKADENFTTSIDAHRVWSDKWIMPLLLDWRGTLYEIQRKYHAAEKDYQECLTLKEVRRLYHHCGALTGLIRVKHAQGDIVAIPTLLAEAEQLAQQYEYNDHLASLRLTQGHLRAETSEVSETSEVWMSQSALDYYKQAMIYALRYNRFLLDELISGRPQGTPLRPIILYCLERGEEGKKILIELRDWWKTGVNDVGAPRPDTISPIPEGIPLLEAEKLAREREPGDGSMQRSMVEQFEAAL